MIRFGFHVSGTLTPFRATVPAALYDSQTSGIKTSSPSAAIMIFFNSSAFLVHPPDITVQWAALAVISRINCNYRIFVKLGKPMKPGASPKVKKSVPFQHLKYWKSKLHCTRVGNHVEECIILRIPFEVADNQWYLRKNVSVLHTTDAEPHAFVSWYPVKFRIPRIWFRNSSPANEQSRNSVISFLVWPSALDVFLTLYQIIFIIQVF